MILAVSQLSRRRAAGPLPDSFLEQVYFHSDLGPCKRLLELGCGFGETAAWFANRGVIVDAVDISPSVIEVARDGGHHSCLSFHCTDAVDYMKHTGIKWDVVSAFDSLHLFMDSPAFVSGLRRAFAPESTLVVGWRDFEWENFCRDEIIAVSAQYGISLRDWGYWTCPTLPAVLGKMGLSWSEEACIEVVEPQVTSVEEAVDFLLSIDRIRRRDPLLRRGLREQLEDVLGARTTAGQFTGRASFSARIISISGGG